jgi:hypothetical protein
MIIDILEQRTVSFRAETEESTHVRNVAKIIQNEEMSLTHVQYFLKTLSWNSKHQKISSLKILSRIV